jgi:hypothetical protein
MWRRVTDQYTIEDQYDLSHIPKNKFKEWGIPEFESELQPSEAAYILVQSLAYSMGIVNEIKDQSYSEIVSKTYKDEQLNIEVKQGQTSSTSSLLTSNLHDIWPNKNVIDEMYEFKSNIDRLIKTYELSEIETKTNVTKFSQQIEKFLPRPLEEGTHIKAFIEWDLLTHSKLITNYVYPVELKLT